MRNVQIRASRTPAVAATEYRAPGSSEAMVGRDGNLNASSTKDLWAQQAKFLQAAASGEVIANETFLAAEAFKKQAQLVQAAFNDPQVHRVLGERMSESLYQTANRQGFMRKYLSRVPVEQGSIPRFVMRMKNVEAVYSTDPTRIEVQVVRDNWFYPPEFQIVARPFITQNELNQSMGDVLQEKYVEAVEAIMVAEDRALYNQANTAVGLANSLSVIAGQLTPYTLMQVRTKVAQWGLKTPHILIANDLYNDIVGNQDFGTFIDPVARHELLLTGELGVMYGMTLTSDAFRHPAHRVLSQGEFFVFSDAVNLGAYSDRGGLVSTPTDINNAKIPGRGWTVFESMAIAIVNPRGVAKGLRV